MDFLLGHLDPGTVLFISRIEIDAGNTATVIALQGVVDLILLVRHHPQGTRPVVQRIEADMIHLKSRRAVTEHPVQVVPVPVDQVQFPVPGLPVVPVPFGIPDAVEPVCVKQEPRPIWQGADAGISFKAVSDITHCHHRLFQNKKSGMFLYQHATLVAKLGACIGQIFFSFETGSIQEFLLPYFPFGTLQT